MTALGEDFARLSVTAVPSNDGGFQRVVDVFSSSIASEVAVPVAAMNALVFWIKQSTASTWMRLEHELRQVINALKKCAPELLGGRTHLSLGSGCDLFMKYVTRSFGIDSMEFRDCKEELLRRGETFAGMSLSARSYIGEIGHSFVQDNCTVLIHGNSRVVTSLILRAAQSKMFNVIVTEGRPFSDGKFAVEQFANAGIPTSLILDCAVGSVMDRVDLCIVGAEAVVENGGIVNKLGTYQIALVAKALKKPFYVAVESYKFARMYPLNQRDAIEMCGQDTTEIYSPSFQSTGSKKSSSSSSSGNGNGSGSTSDTVGGLGNHPSIDFTPAEFITLLFTDLGVLTPAAVSDELIKLYQ